VTKCKITFVGCANAVLFSGGGGSLVRGASVDVARSHQFQTATDAAVDWCALWLSRSTMDAASTDWPTHPSSPARLHLLASHSAGWWWWWRWLYRVWLRDGRDAVVSCCIPCTSTDCHLWRSTTG